MFDSFATIVEMLIANAAANPDRDAIWVNRGNGFQAGTWQQLLSGVRYVAKRLLESGVTAGDRVAQISENRPEWIVCDLAIQSLGAIHVPIHSTLTSQQILPQLEHCDPKVLLVSDEEQYQKLSDCGEFLKQLDGFFCFTNGMTTAQHLDIHFDHDKIIADDFRAACCAANSDDIATILYTSGTTGTPKGVALSHRNLVFNTLATLEAFGERSTDVRLNFLPLSHIFARTCDAYTWLACGSQFAMSQSRETIFDDCKEIQPTLLNGVPYFYDKVVRVLQQYGLQDQPQALQQMLGGRIRMCCSGGAALSDNTFQFFHDRNLPLLQGYGLSETSPVISLSNERFCRVGYAGKPIPGIEVRLNDDCEIVTRGPHVMLGYYKDPQTTAEVIRDGWLQTGDFGELSDDGFLKITGRKKELLVTAAGKNVPPVALETLLTDDPLIIQAMVVGDGKNYLTALIVPDPDELRSQIKSRRILVFSTAQALQNKSVL
ncbi:MAG: long-chain acyl-CoA synthetase, partial [Pirellulaceae bacterium]